MRIKGFVFALLPDFALADDVVQETFLTITRKAHTFELGTDFMKWACSIARFKAMEARRAASKDVRTLSDSPIEHGLLNIMPHLPTHCDPRLWHL